MNLSLTKRMMPCLSPIEALLGWRLDTIIIRPAAKASAVSKQIITLGLIMVILGILPFIFGIDNLQLPR